MLIYNFIERLGYMSELTTLALSEYGYARAQLLAVAICKEIDALSSPSPIGKQNAPLYILLMNTLLSIVAIRLRENLEYVEAKCMGPGADTSKHVPWVKKLGDKELMQFGALDCANPKKVAYTIIVSHSGTANFTKIQSAIDSIPPNNAQWIRIQISPETYQERVTIPVNKPCIFLEGAGFRNTIIEWGDHLSTSASATFTSFPDNIVAKGITFQNTYNVPPRPDTIDLKQAVAARILGDKSAFYSCNFVGLQDTLWDDTGRHLFYQCYVEGAVDFIFGNGQSIYERCVINLILGKYIPGKDHGYITAQARNSSEDPSGFVFKYCTITGTGKTYLGRAYRGYSRVIVVKSTLSDVVKPEGWSAWSYVNHEENIEYVEADCTGSGANTSKRVAWEKKLSTAELSHFVDDKLYIDQEGWIDKLPLSP